MSLIDWHEFFLMSLLRSGMPLFLCACLTWTLDHGIVVEETLDCRSCRSVHLNRSAWLHTSVSDVCLSCVSCVHCLCFSCTNILSLSVSLSGLSLFCTPFSPFHSFPFMRSDTVAVCVWFVGSLSSSVHCILPPHPSIPLQDGDIP